jgi:signal transduction histidine kinase
VTTDPRLAGQIVGNLVDNARKYAKDAEDGRIWVWAKPGERGRLILEVEDRGPGVGVKERGGIFRPFRRGRDADTTAGGAGLGLALARHWADLLGGTLSYRPADGGVGACFRLELPHRG